MACEKGFIELKRIKPNSFKDLSLSMFMAINTHNETNFEEGGLHRENGACKDMNERRIA